MTDLPDDGNTGEGDDYASGNLLSFDVPEMDCPSCAGKVENALSAVEGVEQFETRPTTGTVDVAFDGTATDEAAIVAAVEGAGYAVESDDSGTETGDETSVWGSPRAKKTAVSGLFLALGAIIDFGLPGTNPELLPVAGRTLLVGDLLFLVGIVAGGEIVVRNGYYSARNLNLDIDFLMSAAILSATGVSLAVPGVHLYIEAASLAFLFNVAELLERYSVDRARTSLEELMDLSPDVARVRRETAASEAHSASKASDDTAEVPVEDIDVGEVVLVQPGERIPMDGVVRDGSSAVDESPITGESVPVDKQPGDEVFAGTITEQGYLEVETTARAEDNTISRVVELVEDAQANKTEREQFVERFADYYTPIVVAAALLTAAVPPLLGQPWAVWFLRGISLLVIACPCAFVISTPVTVVSGITSAARNGVLIKGGNYLEAMGEVDAIAFDKTGTLTRGELAVTDVVGLNGNTREDVLRCARGIESRSEHPISEAITEYADDRGVEGRTVEDFESITGKGVRADLDGTPHYAGKPGLFSDLGFDLDHVHLTTDGGVAMQDATAMCTGREDCLDLLEATIPRLQAEGKTIVLVGTEDELEGVIAIADEIRPAARPTLDRLHEMGIEHLVVLTGDNEGTARVVAEAVGVDEYHAGLLPEEKVERVDALVEEYGDVAMVGDGINDAPALATATLGLAMGAAGTDTAIETADIALLADDLSKLPYLYELAHTGNGVIRQNIWGSLAVKAILAVGIPLGYVSVVLAILAGDVGMTTLVTGNAMRLSRLTPGDVFDESK
ncbi:cadmium-transporting ATPase [Halobacteriales archaeon QS_4_62_28]|nr:MAG: cadmium-transporting ATPase [Halobacteriales archaeon QS_4_62_28]